MSVSFSDNICSFIDHCKYISNIYQDAFSKEGSTKTYTLNKKLFYIFGDSQPSNRKRKHGSDALYEECSKIKEMYDQFLVKSQGTLKTEPIVKNISCCTSDVRALAQEVFESTVFDHKGMNGGNNSDHALRCEIRNESFLIPPNSRFFCGCVKEGCEKLYGSKYDLVLADPPWWNKYIRRLKTANDKLSYSMMYNEDIASIPVKNLLSSTCLVAVWCTNALSNIAAVKEVIFPKWGVEYLTTWYWLKVTVDMKPLCEFSTGCKKQPYERIMFGKVGDVTIPESQLIVSVPSALHSHKPPLLELLSPYLKIPNPQTLELFARYLLPNTTSIGYEPLKWQHISLYDKVS